MAWLHNEAKAMKAKVSGLTVSDANAPSGRPVEVRFREPQTELADAVYPMISIEYAGISRDPEREHRGSVYLDYYTDAFPSTGTYTYTDTTGATVPWVEGVSPRSPFYASDAPVPYNIDFRITAQARFATHLEQLLFTLATISYLPVRFGFLEIPEDGTVRSLFLLGGPDYGYNTDADDKRLFTATYLVRVATELDLYAIQYFGTPVRTVDITLDEIE